MRPDPTDAAATPAAASTAGAAAAAAAARGAAHALYRQSLLELKLLLRLRWPLVFPPAAGAWMLFQLHGFAPSLSQNVYRHLIDSQSTFHTLSLGLPLLLGILLVRRDLLNPAFEWIHALPVSNLVFMLSKFAAGFLYMAAIVFFVDAAYLLEAMRSGLPADEIVRQLWRLDLDYFWSYGISLALGMTLGTQLPARFALPVGFCGWVFGSLFLQLFIVERSGMHLFKAFYLNHLLNAGPAWNELWGGSLGGAEYARLRLFVAAFGLFLLAWSAAAVGRSRPYGSPRRATAAAALAFLVACAAFVPYAQLWNARYANLAALRAAAPDRDTGDIRPHTLYAFRVDAMTLELERLPEDRFRASAEFVLPTSGGRPLPAGGTAHKWTPREEGRLTFLLYPTLRVTGVSVDGAPASYTRQGDRLSVPLESLAAGTDTHHIRIGYEGRLAEWNQVGTNEVYLAFLKGDSVYLPAHLGWHPLPGGDSLLFREDGGAVRDRLDAGDDLRADIEVKLHGFGGPLYASIPETTAAAGSGAGSAGVRRFSARGAGAVTLIGGRGLTEVRHAGEPIAIVTTAANRASAARFLAELSERRNYYEAWLGRTAGTLERILYLPDEPVRTRPDLGSSSLASGSMLLLPEGMYQPLDRGHLNRALMMLLFGDDNERTLADDPARPSIVHEIRQSIVDMYDWEHQAGVGTASGPGTAAGATVPVSPGHPLQLRLSGAIQAAMAEGRLELAKQVLRGFYERGLAVRAPYRTDARIVTGRRYPVITWKDWNDAWPEAAGDKGGNGT